MHPERERILMGESGLRRNEPTEDRNLVLSWGNGKEGIRGESKRGCSRYKEGNYGQNYTYHLCLVIVKCLYVVES